MALAPAAVAQASAGLSGQATDPSGASVSGARIVAENSATGAQRKTTTDREGRFHLPQLVAGDYRMWITKPGFATETRGPIHLAVGEAAVVNFRLAIAGVRQQITVNGGASPLNPTTAETPGLVGPWQVRHLPLNGRSYDELLTLNPGIVNFTSQKTGGVGVSNSTLGNNFAVSGNRPQQNLFLLNGIEFTGAAENNMQPGGTSQQMLGVDAIREFNVLRDSYGAEYGKRSGAQVLIVTRSGSNRFHGSAYEFLRNNALDARNYFDRHPSPPFQRNQFGASLGGPVRKNKVFLFGNYEGLRQHLHQTGVDLVPDQNARSGLLPCSLVSPTPDSCPSSGLVNVGVGPGVAPLLNLWPEPTPGAPDFGGIAEAFNNPLQTVRDDFGTARLDAIPHGGNLLTAVSTIDDSAAVTPTSTNLFSTDVESLREQVWSVEETHTFSSELLNSARAGYSRAAYFYTGQPSAGTPAATVPGFIAGKPVGAVVVGGSSAANPAAQVSLAGSNVGSNLHIARNLYTLEDQLGWSRGRNLLNVGVWLQDVRSNEDLALTQFGQATFAGLQQLLEGNAGVFLYDPAPTEMNWRSLLGAWYVEDNLRVTSRLNLSLGYRQGFTTGWNEAHDRAASFVFRNGVIETQPHIGYSALLVNHAKLLAQPRIGIAWQPFGRKTILRAGFGMFNDLQDALGYRMDQNAPFNPSYAIANLSVSRLPLPVSPIPAGAQVSPAGVQPDMKTPTLISYSLRLERELSPGTTLTIGYVGSHGYHQVVSLDDNEPQPLICASAPSCPGAGSRQAYYIPVGTPRANPELGSAWAWFSSGASSYNSMQINLDHRLANGLMLRSSYTWSKALDDGDSLNATAAGNAPGLVSNPFDIHADWGPATYDVRNTLVADGSYQLPFSISPRRDSRFGSLPQALAKSWTVNTIVTLQSGFPFTPELSYNPSNNGDTRNPVRPSVNPSFHGRVILGEPGRWFDPAALIAPAPDSGVYGNLGRNSLSGPGLATWDLSILKQIPVSDRLRVEFRAESFNLLNRANFNTPNLVTFTPSGLSPTAGVITSTSTASRQIQFGLKLLW